MYENKKIFVLITARGGSKRLPGKNIKYLCGKPMIAYSIEQGLNSQYVDEVWVSSDDANILDVSEEYGAKVMKRQDELATDEATSEDVIRHFYNNLQDKPDLIVLLQPTSPIRNKGMIDIIINYFVHNYDRFDSLIPLKKTVIKTGEILGDVYYFKKGEKEILSECGTIFLFKKELINTDNIYGFRIMPYIVNMNNDDSNCIDIDTEFDFKCAEGVLNEDRK